MRNYMQIRQLRNLNVQIFVDEVLKYTGNVNDAPDDLKMMYYSQIEIKPQTPIKLFVYNSMNK